MCPRPPVFSDHHTSRIVRSNETELTASSERKARGHENIGPAGTAYAGRVFLPSTRPGLA
jgi:hypothetical protein